MGIDHRNATPLYLQIVDDISRQIAMGRIKAGEKIRSQSELAGEYGVSLITVKKALYELIREGLLFSRVGKGTYVSEISPLTERREFRSIGFVLTDMNSPFFSRILKSVEKGVSGYGYNLLLSSSENRLEKEEYLIQDYRDLGVRGLIIASMNHIYTASKAIRQLDKEGFPYVVVSYITDPDIYFVGTDHKLGGYIAGKHLISRGYKKIGYINGEPGNRCGEARFEGYRQALEEEDRPLREDLLYSLTRGGEWNDFQSGYEIGLSLAASQDHPDAIFAYNDLTALGFQKAIMEKGFHIPGDIAIVGFDDIDASETAPVPLTTVHQPTEQIGELAVRVLADQQTGAVKTKRNILKPELVVRESA
jgi:LacI family transcriptional regulator